MLGWRSAEGGQGGGGVQAGRETADKSDHGGMPEAVEAEEVHFFQGLLRGPLFDGHAIGGHEDAGAVVAIAAMHEDFLARVVAEVGKELQDLFVGGRGPSADGDIQETHTQGFGLAALPEDSFAIFAAEVDDGSDAEFFELREALGPRLSAAEEMIVDPAAIGDVGEVKLFSVGRMHFRRCGRRRMFLRRKRAWQEGASSEGEKEESATHDDSMPKV
jgi:hypothetical protein